MPIAAGGPLHRGNWRGRVFDRAVTTTGVASQVSGDVVRPHDLRHACASLHIKYGTPAKVLSEMLGHASVSITLDRYGHLYPGDTHQYGDRLRRSRSGLGWSASPLSVMLPSSSSRALDVPFSRGFLRPVKGLAADWAGTAQS